MTATVLWKDDEYRLEIVSDDEEGRAGLWLDLWDEDDEEWYHQGPLQIDRVIANTICKRLIQWMGGTIEFSITRDEAERLAQILQRMQTNPNWSDSTVVTIELNPQSEAPVNG